MSVQDFSVVIFVIGFCFQPPVLSSQYLTCHPNDLNALEEFMGGLKSVIGGWGKNFSDDCCKWAGLMSNTLYQYQCGDPSIPAMSNVSYFQTMPVSGPESYPSRIAVVGDLGLTYNTTSTVDHLLINHPDLLLLVGDVSDANLYFTKGTADHCFHEQTYQPRWDYWGRGPRLFEAVEAFYLCAGVDVKYEEMIEATSIDSSKVLRSCTAQLQLLLTGDFFDDIRFMYCHEPP